MRRPWKLLALTPVLLGAAVMFHPIAASASPVPTGWCSISYESWDSVNPDTANAWGQGSCSGPIENITVNVALFANNNQTQVGTAYDSEDNSSFAGNYATDYCDYDNGGCYGDNAFSSWIGVTFETARGWYDSGSMDGNTCQIFGNWNLCQVSPGWWNWP
jgi:hypothetical protein